MKSELCVASSLTRAVGSHLLSLRRLSRPLLPVSRPLPPPDHRDYFRQVRIFHSALQTETNAMGDDNERARTGVFSAASAPRRPFVDSGLPYPDAPCSSIPATLDDRLPAPLRALWAPAVRTASSSAPSVLQLLAADTAGSRLPTSVPSTSASVRSARNLGQGPGRHAPSYVPNKRRKRSMHLFSETSGEVVGDNAAQCSSSFEHDDDDDCGR